MLPAVKEKLLGQQFEDLGQLAQRVGMIGSQFQNMRREPRFQKDNAFANMYQQFLADAVEDDYEDEVAFALPMDWSKKGVEVPNTQEKEGDVSRYDIDVAKSEKLFALLVHEGIIKLPPNHSMLAKGGVKSKK